MRRTLLAAGFLVIALLDIAFLLYFYAWASIVNPDWEVGRQRAEILRKMFWSREALGTAVALTLIITGLAGFLQALRRPRNC